MKKLFFKQPLFALAMFLIIIGITSGCKKSSDSTPSSAPANEVWIQSNAFSPSTITVSVNTTIKWTNKDAANHTVTSDNNLFSSNTLGKGGEYSHQFTTAGTFTYKCNFHPSMKGTVVVQ